MISIHTVPARLRAVVLSYLYGRYALRLQIARGKGTVRMPEFTLRDLAKLPAEIRQHDILAGCFLPPRSAVWAWLPFVRRHAIKNQWGVTLELYPT